MTHGVDSEYDSTFYGVPGVPSVPTNFHVGGGYSGGTRGQALHIMRRRAQE